MHHLVLLFGINFQIHFVSLTTHQSCLVSIHLLIHLLTHLSHHPLSHHTSLLRFFTHDYKTYFFSKSCPLQSTSLTYWTAFVIMEMNRTCHAHQFIFRFGFLIFGLFRVVD